MIGTASPPRVMPPDDDSRESLDPEEEEDVCRGDVEANDHENGGQVRSGGRSSEAGSAGIGITDLSRVGRPSYADLSETFNGPPENEETSRLDTAGRHETSVYLQELRGQRRRARLETDGRLAAEEVLARRIQDELTATEDSQTASEVDEDAELASRVATMLMKEELEAGPQGKPAGSTNSASLAQEEANASLSEEQRRILELIQQERERRLINGAMQRSELAGSRSLHLPANDNRLISPQNRHHSTPNSLSSVQSNHSASSMRPQPSETPEQIQRRKEAYERQFYDRTTGSLEVTPAEREILRKTGSIDPGSHHVHGRSQFQGPQTSHPSYQRHVRPLSPHRVATSPDWDLTLSRRQAMFEREQNEFFRLQTLNASELGSECLNVHALQQLRPGQQPQRFYTRGDNREANSPLLRHGQTSTQRTVRTGPSQIVVCQGCGNRLHVPGKTGILHVYH